MSRRIALASTDGLYINQHFGHAETFYIVDYDEAGHGFIEKRRTTPSCTEHDRHGAGFENVVTLLSDCDGIYVSQIGQYAASYLIHKGLRVFVAPYAIESVIEKLKEQLILGM